jgi:hypothetical protein
MTQCIPLNPCDYLYYVHDRQVRKLGIGGSVGFLIVETAGYADPGAVQRAFAATLAEHPVTLAKLRFTPILGHPTWSLPDDIPQAVSRAMQVAYRFDDFTSSTDWEHQLNACLQARFSPSWELFPTSLMSLEQYALPGDRTWLSLRWPHMLMDAGGGQWFLSELGRFSQTGPDTPGERAAELASDYQLIDPLAEKSLWQKLNLCWRGLSHKSEYQSLRVAAITPKPPPRIESQGFIRKTWPADMVRRMRTNAESFAPPGPASHARFLAACVIRALHQIYTQRNIIVDAYPVSLPLSMTDTESEDDDAVRAPSRRPMPGNYLVAPTLYGRRELIDDRVALGQDLLKQLQEFYARDGHLSQWAMIWLASKMRVWMYDWVYKRRIGVEPLASGFSYYGQIPRPVRRICGTKVTNLWGTAPLSTPPGWNPIFNKHQGKLNLGFAYNRPAIPDDLANEFVARIEREIFEA